MNPSNPKSTRPTSASSQAPSPAATEMPFVRPTAVQIVTRNLRHRTASAMERVRNLQHKVQARAARHLDSTAALRWSYELMNTSATPIRLSRYHE